MGTYHVYSLATGNRLRIVHARGMRDALQRVERRPIGEAYRVVEIAQPIGKRWE